MSVESRSRVYRDVEAINAIKTLARAGVGWQPVTRKWKCAERKQIKSLKRERDCALGLRLDVQLEVPQVERRAH